MFGVSVEIAIVAADRGHEYHTAGRWLLTGSVALAFSAMAAIQLASVRSDREQLRRSVIINRLVGIPIVLVIGLVPGIGAVWTMALVTAVCTGEIVADLAAANPGVLRRDAVTVGESNG